MKDVFCAIRHYRVIPTLELAEITELVKEHFTVLSESAYRFNNSAITFTLILGESHFVLHDYLEHNVVFVNMFTCATNHTDELLSKLLEDISGVLLGEIIKIDITNRLEYVQKNSKAL